MQEPSYSNRRNTLAANAVGKRWDAELRRKQRASLRRLAGYLRRVSNAAHTSAASLSALGETLDMAAETGLLARKKEAKRCVRPA